MEVDNAAGNRNDLGSNGEEELVPGGPVVAANAGAMGEPDRAGRLLDDNFWEDNDLQEGEPAGFLSSLNGSDDDTMDEEPAEEEDEEQEEEQRQQPEAATQEGGAEEIGPVFGVVDNDTKDPDDDRELPECFRHELIGKPPKNSSIGGVLVDLLGVKADYELPTAAYEEILYILNTALGNDRRAVGDCTTAVRKNRKIIQEPDGIYFDFGIIEILWRMLRRPDSAANQPYRQDLYKNAFLNSDFGRQLKEATDGAIADAANLIMDVGIDGVQLTKFKHHSATVYVSRVANVPRYKLIGRGYHAAFFACMWCLFQGIHLDGVVRFLGYFAAAAQTLWHQAFNPILTPGNGVRDTRARQEGEAQKRCITEVLRDPGRQCVQSCFAGADGSMLTDTELEALQRASTVGKLPKGLTGSAHTFLLRMGEVQVRSHGLGSAMIKFKNFYRVRYFRKVIVGKCSKDPERAFAVEVMKQTYVEEFGPDGLKVQDIREGTTNIKMTYYGRMEALKPDQESYTVYLPRAYNRLPKGNAWVLTAQRWEKWGAGLVPLEIPTVGAACHQRLSTLDCGEGPINTVFQQDFVFPPKHLWCSYVKHYSHAKDIAALDEDDGGVDAGQ
eukprot:jgi/Tetstr1/436372/TSEL_025205.t1